MSFLALIGVLGLIGVLVNDSLVMVASLNRLKLERSTNTEQGGRHLSDQETDLTPFISHRYCSILDQLAAINR